jgi:hypothetical protein
MANLCIKQLYDAAWKVFQFQHDLAVADRDCLKSEIEKRLGSEMVSEIQSHIEVALGRLQSDDVPNPLIMSKSEFFDLLAAEMEIQEIADRIEANAKFSDPGSLLPTLGFLWQEDRVCERSLVSTLGITQKGPGQTSPQ